MGEYWKDPPLQHVPRGFIAVTLKPEGTRLRYQRHWIEGYFWAEWLNATLLYIRGRPRPFLIWEMPEDLDALLGGQPGSDGPAGDGGAGQWGPAARERDVLTACGSPIMRLIAHPDRSQARLQIVRLYYQGWDKVSLSRFMQISHTASTFPGSVPFSVKADDGGLWNNERGTFGKEGRINS